MNGQLWFPVWQLAQNVPVDMPSIEFPVNPVSIAATIFAAFAAIFAASFTVLIGIGILRRIFYRLEGGAVVGLSPAERAEMHRVEQTRGVDPFWQEREDRSMDLDGLDPEDQRGYDPFWREREEQERRRRLRHDPYDEDYDEPR